MKKDILSQIGEFRTNLQAFICEHYKQFPSLTPPTVDVKVGKKYAKVIKTDNQRSVHSFINMSNGDILMAASWSAPSVKTPRGNIYDENCGVGYAVDAYGARYLK